MRRMTKVHTGPTATWFRGVQNAAGIAIHSASALKGCRCRDSRPVPRRSNPNGEPRARRTRVI
ncbi:uncharacterized protein SCHCODRAFT_02627213, partial [Schizophyllum commune H4-8]|uniref:uncharacterized protein n=1 Tax=Schizophyllum commune (strain H4-8 / FGSC 9210) TaxID=578458 RepID=UPI00215F788C